ncbi:MAG: hypothetical protein ACRDJ4_12725 [Actinomycetota bacterium]
MESPEVALASVPAREDAAPVSPVGPELPPEVIDVLVASPEEEDPVSPEPPVAAPPPPPPTTIPPLISLLEPVAPESPVGPPAPVSA